MDDIRFACSHCGQHLEAPPDMGGESVQCPNCSKTIEVPAPPGAATQDDADLAPEVPVPTATDVAVYRPVDANEAGEDDAEASTTRTCPNCEYSWQAARRGDRSALPECPSCGNSLKTQRADRGTSESVVLGESYTRDTILSLLSKYKGQSGFFLTPDIPSKKLSNGTAAVRLPATDEVLALLDGTVLGSAKIATVFGVKGVYWVNDPAVDTARAGVFGMTYAQLADAEFSWAYSGINISPNLYLHTHGYTFSNQMELLRAIQKAVRGVDADKDLNAISSIGETYELCTPQLGIERNVSLETIRTRLETGEIDRSTHVRKVSKKPNNLKKQGAKAAWLDSRKFRRIGDSIAQTEFDILRLYDPVTAYRRRGRNAGLGIGFAAGVVLVLLLAGITGKWTAVGGGALMAAGLCALPFGGAEGLLIGAIAVVVGTLANLALSHFGEGSKWVVYLIGAPVFMMLLRSGKGCLTTIAILVCIGGFQAIQSVEGSKWLLVLAAVLAMAVPTGISGLIGTHSGNAKGQKHAQTDRVLPTDAMVGPQELDPAGIPLPEKIDQKA